MTREELVAELLNERYGPVRLPKRNPTAIRRRLLNEGMAGSRIAQQRTRTPARLSDSPATLRATPAPTPEEEP